MDRTYEKALEVIDSRKRLRRPDAITPKTGPRSRTSMGSGSVTPGLRGMPGLTGMAEWLQQIGHSARDVNNLNIIHVAGTKGKGSTCSFTESFLRAYGERTGYPAKTGLYTSPHLLHPEERIHLDGTTIDRRLFAAYFFEIYDRLPELHSHYEPSKPIPQRGPRTLQLYALLAFHIFLREKVHVAIFETHSGGEYDATNVVEKPVVTAITTLGMDHIATLGPTIEDIAWHKAGIFKTGATALSTRQSGESVECVLRERVLAKGEVVRFLQDDERLPAGMKQLEPAVQRKNASLALAAAEAWLGKRGREALNADDIRRGVGQWSWPGRFQTVCDVGDARCTWYLDAAHNDMSVAIAAQWFAAETAAALKTTTRSAASGEGCMTVLIFSHINELRDSIALLSSLAASLLDNSANIDHVIFTTYAISALENGSSVESVSSLHDVWRSLQPTTQIWDEASIEEAIERARSVGEGVTAEMQRRVLITGSQHLVGPALEILQP